MKTKIISGALAIIVIAALSLSGYAFLNKKKIAYVDNIYLFENCKMKKDLYAKVEESTKVRELVLDSLKNGINAMGAGQSVDIQNPLYREIQKQQENYFQKQKKFSEEVQVQFDDANKKIWDYISQRTIEYGKVNNYHYLLGANGQGSIMYAKDNENVSEKVLEFINNKYEDKNN